MKYIILIFLFFSFSFASIQIYNYESFIQNFNDINKIISLLIWPLILVISYALSNDFVTGSIFGIDRALFLFWNISKNFAFYLVGFLFLYGIISYIFNKNVDIKKLILNTTLASIFISASWFIIGALLDISTILTLAVGSIPYTVVKDLNFQYYDTKLIINYGDKINEKGPLNNYTILYKDKDSYFLPCILSGNEINMDQLKSSAENIKNSFNYNISTEKCIYYSGGNVILYPDNNSNNFGSQTKDLFSPNFIAGPLYFIASFIFNSKTFAVGGNIGIGKLTFDTIINFLFIVLLISPLVAFAFVSILRLIYLWVVIGFSPFIVLLYFYQFLGGGFKNFIQGIKIFNLKDILTLIFLPVVVTFAISISLIILTISKNLIQTNNNKSLVTFLKTETTSDLDCIVIKDQSKLCIKKNNVEIGIADYISMFIINIFVLLIIWSILFSALKTSSLTSGVVSSIETLSKTAFYTTPILPGGHSLGSLSKTLQNIKTSPYTIISEQQTKLQNVIDNIFNKHKKTNDNNTNKQ